eukprot:scaffold443_cov177-Amphora_coffeaeformis.AAC.8
MAPACAAWYWVCHSQAWAMFVVVVRASRIVLVQQRVISAAVGDDRPVGTRGVHYFAAAIQHRLHKSKDPGHVSFGPYDVFSAVVAASPSRATTFPTGENGKDYYSIVDGD